MKFIYNLALLFGMFFCAWFGVGFFIGVAKAGYDFALALFGA
jgi:hypothetical protein